MTSGLRSLCNCGCLSNQKRFQESTRCITASADCTGDIRYALDRQVLMLNVGLKLFKDELTKIWFILLDKRPVFQRVTVQDLGTSSVLKIPRGR
ncbi:MAG: hypothetical protein ACMUEM_06995 [Flavobacteriales bacterium AspAUS03]